MDIEKSSLYLSPCLLILLSPGRAVIGDRREFAVN